MATREEIGLAMDVLRMVNRMGEMMRSQAEAVLNNQNTRLNVILDDTEKKAKLVSGLNALNVDPLELQTDKDAVVTQCDNVLANIPDLLNL